VDDKDLEIRGVPWNHLEPAGGGWFRREWRVEFGGRPHLAPFVVPIAPATSSTSTWRILSVIRSDGNDGIRLETLVANDSTASKPASSVEVRRLDAETIAYDSLILQRLAECGPKPITINGWPDHPILKISAADHSET
jgi:hypothetical protein